MTYTLIMRPPWRLARGIQFGWLLSLAGSFAWPTLGVCVASARAANRLQCPFGLAIKRILVRAVRCARSSVVMPTDRANENTGCSASLWACWPVQRPADPLNGADKVDTRPSRARDRSAQGFDISGHSSEGPLMSIVSRRDSRLAIATHKHTDTHMDANRRLIDRHTNTRRA